MSPLSSGDSPAPTKIDDHYHIAFRMHAYPMALSTVADGRYVEISDAFCEILGFPRDEVLGRTSTEMGLWTKPKQRDALMAQLSRGGNVRDLRLDFRTKSGETCTGLFSADIVDIDGQPHMLSVMNDITDRLRAERERKLSDERYRLVSELTSDYAYSFVVDPDKGLELEWISGAIEGLTGFTQQETKARGGWESLIHPDDMSIPHHQLQSLLEGRTETVVYRMFTKSRETRWVRDYARPELDPGTGKLTRIHGAVQDITEYQREMERRLELETQVQQSQKLESLGLLAGGIAHDFNNLLMAIVGQVELADDDLPDDSPARRSLAEIRKTSTHATELVQQLLAYAGKGDGNRERLDLKKLVEEMAGLLGISTSGAVELKLEFADDVPAITADATQIRQVCMNLVTNAAEAIGDTGVVALRIGQEELNGPPDGQATPYAGHHAGPHVYLEVEDNGAGMDAAPRHKIFEPFFSTRREGRGLGLAVVQGIVRSHGGLITLRSEPGAGSIFRVYFPADGGVEA